MRTISAAVFFRHEHLEQKHGDAGGTAQPDAGLHALPEDRFREPLESPDDEVIPQLAEGFLARFVEGPAVIGIVCEPVVMAAARDAGGAGGGGDLGRPDVGAQETSLAQAATCRDNQFLSLDAAARKRIE